MTGNRDPETRSSQPLHSRSRLNASLESQRVCEIVGRIADEVLSEVRAGTWQPPTTTRIDPRPRMSAALRNATDRIYASVDADR